VSHIQHAVVAPEPGRLLLSGRLLLFLQALLLLNVSLL
jgi:hypothetical protein